MLQANKNIPKCKGQAPDGTMICSDRNRCGLFLRPEAPGQVYDDNFMAGDRCQHYQSVPSTYHICDEEPARVEWDERAVKIEQARTSE